MSIFDCFMYFDEDMLLDIRLNILNKYVKKFIIVESSFLHSGKKKKLNFNINNFIKFKDKIIYVSIDELPSNLKSFDENDNELLKNKIILDNSVLRENYQRNFLSKSFDNISSEDLILISDLDEIPNLENFSHNKKISFFEQNVFYYKFNLMQPNFKWVGTRACKKKHLISPQWLRNIKNKIYPVWRLDVLFSKKKYSDINLVKNGGWHFTSIKKPEDIFFKFSNYLHHLEFEESKINIQDVKKLIQSKKIIYDHSVHQQGKKFNSKNNLVKVNNDFLPNYLTQNKDKFLDWFD